MGGGRGQYKNTGYGRRPFFRTFAHRGWLPPPFGFHRIRDVGVACSARLRSLPLPFEDYACSTVSSVDNFYTFGFELVAAIAGLQVVETTLWNRWKLRFGSDSKQIMDCSKSLVKFEDTKPEFAPVSHMSVLGCKIQASGSCELCFADTHSKMWRCFHANFGKALLMTNLKKTISMASH